MTFREAHHWLRGFSDVVAGKATDHPKAGTKLAEPDFSAAYHRGRLTAQLVTGADEPA